MGKDAPQVVVLDASVLINFLCIDRAELLAHTAQSVLITEHVVAEVTDDFPDQLSRLNAAISSGLFQVVSVTDVNELASIADLRRVTKARLGFGECSAIAVAVQRGFHIAVDDGAAIKQIRKLYPLLTVQNTQDLMLLLIRAGILPVEDADSIKDDWKQSHSFALKLTSFRELL